MKIKIYLIHAPCLDNEVAGEGMEPELELNIGHLSLRTERTAIIVPSRIGTTLGSLLYRVTSGNLHNLSAPPVVFSNMEGTSYVSGKMKIQFV